VQHFESRWNAVISGKLLFLRQLETENCIEFISFADPTPTSEGADSVESESLAEILNFLDRSHDVGITGDEGEFSFDSEKSTEFAFCFEFAKLRDSPRTHETECCHEPKYKPETNGVSDLITSDDEPKSEGDNSSDLLSKIDIVIERDAVMVDEIEIRQDFVASFDSSCDWESKFGSDNKSRTEFEFPFESENSIELDFIFEFKK
jgi:hypothetical protein